MLVCCYDLGLNPPTYDVVTFLLTRERERLRKGENTLSIEIRPGPIDGFRRDNCWPRDPKERRALLNNIVIPMCSMLPSCERVTVMHDASRDTTRASGFGEYSIPFRHFVSCIAEGIRPLRPSKEMERQAGLITMTLRESEHWPKRNSKTDEWLRAAEVLKERGYKVVIVRDTVKGSIAFHVPGRPAGWFQIDSTASINLQDRAALYRSAECNLFVNNGPAWFCMALDAPMVMLRPATEGISRIYGVDGRRAAGMIPGQNMKGSPPHQRLVWDDDTSENIVRAALNFTEQKEKPGCHSAALSLA